MNSPGGLNVGGVYYDVELNTGKLMRDSREADSALRGVEFRMGAVALAVKALAAALALVKMAQVADDMRLLAARVEVAAGSVERGAEAFNQLARISARTQTELAANVQVFTRLNASLLQMGGTQQDTLRVTELLAMAIKVSGASAQEAAAAMTQFGQALGSGQLQGDELRSLLENAPFLMRQLADGIGVPVGALKQLGEEGKLTADVVVAALSRAAGQIEADFAKLPQTFDAAMGALLDQLRMASEAADDLSGTSAALTGVTRGAADAVGLLADQLRAASGEASGLSRNDAIAEWSRRTTMVLSYVADAADLTWQTLSVLGRNVRFVFEGVGRELGGIGAQIAAVMRGDFAQARAIGEAIRADAQAARAELDAADARSLGGRQLAGQAMRERMAAMASGTDGSDPMDRRARAGTPSTLRAPGRGDADAAAKAAKAAADAERKAGEERNRGYLEQLAGEERIREEQDRLSQEFLEKQQRRREQEAQAEERARQDRQQGQVMAFDALAAGNPVAQLGLELERRTQLLREAAARDQENEALYAEARVQLANDTAARILQIQADEAAQRQALQSQTLQAYGGLFGSLADLSKQFAGEQSGIYKAMFVASKAFAIADSIIKIQQGIAGALATGATWQEKLVAAGSVASAASGIVSTIRGTNYGGGRQFGGPVSAGTMYRVNETGAPEMFVGSGGRQFMLPTTSGQVVPADEVGGAGGVQVVVNNYTGAPVDVQQSGDGRMIEIAVGRAVGEVATQIRDNAGPVFSALTSSTNVRPRM